ncbi:MAG: class I SAM-dependent methyltransferase [Candidatus Eremiobacteraeota bacterium]|nr:class I SAM-dependent methyltransferase [Candidatus Eremiobacteraeota bacterium]
MKSDGMSSAGSEETEILWQKLFQKEQDSELSVIGYSDGIMKVKRTIETSNGQELEHAIRDNVAMTFLESDVDNAVDEAKNHHSNFVMKKKVNSIMRMLKHSSGDESLLIDLGCGFGWHWVEAARENSRFRFLLVDFSLNNLLVARKLMPFDRYPNVLCLQSDILHLPIISHMADFIWSVQVMQHLPQDKRKRTLNEMKRIGKPLCRFYIAWIRSVPLIELIYSILRRKYHKKGILSSGMFFQRYDREVEEEFNNLFSVKKSYSEGLFHPELRLISKNNLVGIIDDLICSTFLGYLCARQIEIWGTMK